MLLGAPLLGLPFPDGFELPPGLVEGLVAISKLRFELLLFLPGFFGER